MISKKLKNSKKKKTFFIFLTIIILSVGIAFFPIKKKKEAKAAKSICTAITATLDIVFAIDSTESMEEVINTAQTQAIDIMNGIESALADFSPDVQYGVIDFRDYADGAPWPYIIRQRLTKDKNAVENAINAISVGGGGDCPEAYARVMYESYNSSVTIGYRPEASKILLMIGDDLPHDKAEILDPGRSKDSPYAEDPGTPGHSDPVGGFTDDILNNMKSKGITLIALVAPTDCGGAAYWVTNWDGWAKITGGSAYAISTAPADLVSVIVRAVSRAIFDKDGDGYMTMECPCDPSNPPNGLKCYDCDDTHFDATQKEAWKCLLGGFVPCGRMVDNPDTEINETAPCTLCHLFVLGKRIIDFLAKDVLFPLAVLMIVIGGVMFLTAAGNPGRIETSKKILTSVVIGLLIIFLAWLIVDTIIMFMTKSGSPFQNWKTINCPVP